MLTKLLLIAVVLASFAMGAVPATAAPTQATPISQPGMGGVCPVSLPGPEGYNVGNYGNDARAPTVWPAGVVVFTPVDGVPEGGPFSMKFWWFRLKSGALTFTGRRLDAAAPALTADVPTGYGNHGFTPVGIIFPTVGCWEVTGHLAGESLRFVTVVIFVPAAMLQAPPATPTP